MESCLQIVFLILVSFLTVFVNFGSCDNLEQGLFDVVLDEDHRFGGVLKNLAEDTEIAIKVNCVGKKGKFKIEWIVRYTECNELDAESENATQYIKDIFGSDADLGMMFKFEDYIAIKKNNASNELDCKEPHSFLQDDTSTDPYPCYSKYHIENCEYRGVITPTEAAAAPPASSENPVKNPVKAGNKGNVDDTIKRRDAEAQVTPAAPTAPAAPTPAAPTPAGPTQEANSSAHKPLKGRVTTINGHAGRYWVLVHFKPLETLPKEFKVTLKIQMKSPSGYLSAYQAPLLVFYGVMCGVYSILTFIWLVLLALQWRDLLRIQFWIGGVMLLGLLEKAVFYAEYEKVNEYGTSVPGAIIMAELISCFKRSLARMLVVIVSLGYGITRPRLGKDLHWVLGVGMLYFILSSVEACLRVKGSDQNDLIAILPLSVLDAIICWWIFKSLVDTTRTLRLRRNMAKLWLYRHFTNTLIFCVVAAFIFLLWSMKVHRWTQCLKKWNELWLDDAYWHVLFFVILIVIVILFRPTANNQRYAYSPLTDREGDDESREPMLSDAFEGMKMRNVMTNRNESQTSNKADDDLKWVEDNIPAAVADAALGAFDDSEEELVTTLERSKME